MSHLLLKHAKLILVWGLIFSLISGGISFLISIQYSAASQVLIISRDRTGVDPYTQAKSSERISENLAQIIKTVDFYKKVMESTSYTFDKNNWQNLTDRKQRKKWQKDIQATVVYGTGLMNIVGYSNSKTDAVNLSNAVAQTLASVGWEYVGGNISLKVVSSPLASRLPARPNFILNTIIGFVVGVLFSSFWVIRYKKHHLLG